MSMIRIPNGKLLTENATAIHSSRVESEIKGRWGKERYAGCSLLALWLTLLSGICGDGIAVGGIAMNSLSTFS
jgi:hypothetical protein